MKGEKYGGRGGGYGRLNLVKIVVSGEELFYGLTAAGPLVYDGAMTLRTHKFWIITQLRT